jgi:hypothetical protein
VDGDQSALSYLQASILARELDEFGAGWHGLTWSTHRILEEDLTVSDFANRASDSRQDRASWKWQEAVTEWRPACIVNDALIQVVFYTYSELYTRSIVRHRDVYRPGSYKCESEQSVVAGGGPGFCF